MEQVTVEYLALDKHQIDRLHDSDIARDVFRHMAAVRDRLSLHKFQARSAVNQLAFSVAKKFGHKSSYHDLEVRVPRMVKPPGQPYEFVAMDGLTTLKGYWRVALGGRESMEALGKGGDRLGGHLISKHTISIYFTEGFRTMLVEIETSPRVLLNIITSFAKNKPLAIKMSQLVHEKWGELGMAGARKNQETGDFDFKYLRYVDGIQQRSQDGWRWMGGVGDRAVW